MNTLSDPWGIRLVRGARHSRSFGLGCGGKRRFRTTEREPLSGEWSYMSAGHEGRAANGGRRQLCTFERQTLGIEGRHLPARGR